MFIAADRWLTTKLSAVVTVLVCVIILSTCVPAAANPFVDVPSGHWAYRALEQLGAASLIDGYSPGFFTGARRLTRYEMALSVAGALARLRGDDTLLAAADEYDLDELVAEYNARAPHRPLSSIHTALLRAMVVEFQAELAMLGYSVPNVGPPATVEGDTMFAEQYVLDASFTSLARQRLLSGRATASERQLVDVQIGPVNGDGIGAAAPGVELSQRVIELSSAVPLGRIGSTVLFTESHTTTSQVQAWQRTETPSLDGSIQLSEYALPGSLLSESTRVDSLLPYWPGTETRIGVEGIPVTPFLSLAGERAQRTNLVQDTGATSLRATVRLGQDVSLAGSVRTVEPGFEPDDGEAVGLGLTVRLGDVLLSTGRDIVQRSETDDAEHVTTWSLEYSLAEQALVRAGWQTVSDTRSRASVDVNVPVPLGALHLGLAYEGSRTGESGISMTTLTMAGLDLRVTDNAEARAAISLQDGGEAPGRTTSLGLRYSLGPEAALMLGYKLIDFSGEDDEVPGRLENVTTAEFTIRF